MSLYWEMLEIEYGKLKLNKMLQKWDKLLTE